MHINALRSGKHYNRCWWVHEILCDALERLFIIQYLPEHEKTLNEMGLLNNVTEIIECSSNDQEVADIMQKYQEIKLKGLQGELGKTAHFWLTYTELISQLHLLYFAINTNNLTHGKHGRNFYHSALLRTKIHYARYATFYIQQLKSLEESHPGAIQEIKESVSVRRNWIGIGQAIDLAGEQTYMKNAKTIGGITGFSVKQETVTKWVLTRPFQTRYCFSYRIFRCISPPFKP